MLHRKQEPKQGLTTRWKANGKQINNQTLILANSKHSSRLNEYTAYSCNELVTTLIYVYWKKWLSFYIPGTYIVVCLDVLCIGVGAIFSLASWYLRQHCSVLSTRTLNINTAFDAFIIYPSLTSWANFSLIDVDQSYVG